VPLSHRASPRPANEPTLPRGKQAEEVIVRGRRLGELRSEVRLARERAYGIFNEINGSDDFDVYCREEVRTGTRSTDRVCRAQFESRISADAAHEYMSSLSWRCPAGQRISSTKTRASGATTTEG
jgi:hypothetical protein